MSEDEQLREWRDAARTRCAVFATRYSSGGIGAEYVRLAERWSQALAQTDPDPGLLQEILAEAERDEYRADIAMFGFINEMRSIYRALWEKHLSGR